MKIRCKECKGKDLEKGQEAIDFDKGIYEVVCRCKRCGNSLTLTFTKVSVKHNE